MRASTGDSGVRVLPEVFKHRLLQVAEETLDSLQAIWKEAGYEEIEQQRLLGDLLNKMKLTCSNELAAEQQILEHAKLEVEAKIEEYEHLNAQLGREANIDHIDVLNYSDKLSELEKLISTISVEVGQRSKLLNTEIAKIEELTELLGSYMPNMSIFDGPEGTCELSDIRLGLMQDYVATLESTKAQRIEEMKKLALDCKSHIADLSLEEEGFNTMSLAEQYAKCDKSILLYINKKQFTFDLHQKDLTQLSCRLKSFTEEKDKRREELAKTGAEIARLWSLLRTPAVERENFQSSFKMNLSMSTLTKGVEELERLREVRATSMKSIIASIRSDIETLWNEAGIESIDNRSKEFALYFEPVESLQDSAVEEHEAYFSSLRKRVEELKPLLLKVSRREGIIQDRIELEHIQLNPERLTARGPNAREERKREEAMTRGVRTLDKVTKDLMTHIATWEEANGPFTYAGERYAERVSSQEEQYIEIRDALRESRKKGKTTKDAGNTAASSFKPTLATANSNRRTTTNTHGNVTATPCAKSATSRVASVTKTVPKEKPIKEEPAVVITPVVDENIPNKASIDRCSSASDGSQVSQLTEVKERPSTATILRTASAGQM